MQDQHTGPRTQTRRGGSAGSRDRWRAASTDTGVKGWCDGGGRGVQPAACAVTTGCRGSAHGHTRTPGVRRAGIPSTCPKGDNLLCQCFSSGGFLVKKQHFSLWPEQVIRDKGLCLMTSRIVFHRKAIMYHKKTKT